VTKLQGRFAGRGNTKYHPIIKPYRHVLLLVSRLDIQGDSSAGRPGAEPPGRRRDSHIV
jgi:hypothetical protein